MSPSSLEYDVIDVFTDEKFAGNPLAVVRLTADDDLNQDQKHKITSEFNLSETVFLNPAKDGKRQIDIFTPGSELAFAGRESSNAISWPRICSTAIDQIPLSVQPSS